MATHSKDRKNTQSSSSRQATGSTGKSMVVPLLPLRDVIIFPHMVVPLFVGREKSINALEECVNKKIDLFLVAQREATTVTPGDKDVFQVGTLGTILQILRLPDNTVKVLIEGRKRARMLKFTDGDRMIGRCDAQRQQIGELLEHGAHRIARTVGDLCSGRDGGASLAQERQIGLDDQLLRPLAT